MKLYLNNLVFRQKTVDENYQKLSLICLDSVMTSRRLDIIIVV